MRAFAISPGAAEALSTWVSRLPALATDVVLREPAAPESMLREAAETAIARQLRVWVHRCCPDAETLADAMGCGLHLPAAAPPTTRPHGRSCHGEAALRRAFEEGAEYAFLSPVFRPTSKPEDPRTPLGVPGFLALAANRPVAALGGITVERADQLRDAGAWGVAVLGAWR